jgi:enoyl-CoA hydratase/carnithine racemase
LLCQTKSNVGIITLNRPKALNALCDGLLEDLIHASRAYDQDDNIGCIVVTGSEKAFAAGAGLFLKKEFFRESVKLRSPCRYQGDVKS